MTGPTGAVDFFAIEAGEYLDRIDAALDAASRGAPDVDALARNARALRGAATMARQAPLADLAAAMEAAVTAVRGNASAYTPALADALVAAVDAYRALLRVVRSWDPAAAERAATHAAELRRAIAGADAAAPRASTIVPISRLFYDDDGPHVVQRNPHPPITADLRFRQAAVPLASTLRRLIADARHAVDDGVRRSLGDDLRAALRDLGELAESYDIAAVANFARAREGPLVRLDERALEVVDGAAQALVESASTVWARPTPTGSIGVIEPPTAAGPVEAPLVETEATTADTVAPDEPEPAAVPEPGAPPAPASHAPPSGQALVALLETSISGLHHFGDDVERTEPPTPPASSDGIVSIRALEYRGRAALDRARTVRDLLRGADTPDPTLLAELYDLLDLAADEPIHA